jgi:hypothetical protein
MVDEWQFWLKAIVVFVIMTAIASKVAVNAYSCRHASRDEAPLGHTEPGPAGSTTSAR